jgi:hypothetical protein
MKAQLHAFASGERHNDISQQMRNVARDDTAGDHGRGKLFGLATTEIARPGD